MSIFGKRFAFVQKIKNLSDRKWFFPFFLFALMGFAYGLSLSSGFFWDDWEALYFAKTRDPFWIIDFYKFDRPVAGMFYWLCFRVLGVGAFQWHLVTLLVRFFAYFFLYKTFSRFFRGYDKWIQIAVLLIAVFPGFQQSPMTLAYFRVYISLLLFSLSLYFSLLAVEKRQKKWFFHSIAIQFSFLQCLLVEYFVVLEGIRFFLFYFYKTDEIKLDWKQRGKEATKMYLPYLIVLLLYGVFRFYFVEAYFEIENTNQIELIEQFSQGNFGYIVDFIQIAVQDMVSMCIHSFAIIFDPEAIQNKPYILFSYLIGFLVALGIVVFYSPEERKEKNTVGVLIAVGLLMFLFGGIPVWLMGDQSFVGMWADRYLLAPMIGIAFLAAGFLSWLTKNSKRGMVVLALLVGLSAAFQIRNTYEYHQEWKEHKSIYWQLAWRLPGLDKGTLFVSPKMEISKTSRYSLGIAMNYLFSEDNQPVHPDYWYLNFTRAFGDDQTKIDPETKVNLGIRSISYKEDLSRVIGIAFPQDVDFCLRILDEPYDIFPAYSEFGFVERGLYEISIPNKLLNDEPNPVPEDVFGAEPEHGWCYYFQKADLARQKEDWKEVEEIFREVETIGLSSKVVWEYVPFLTSFAELNDWQAFRDLSFDLAKESRAYQLTPFFDYIEGQTADNEIKAEVLSEVLEIYLKLNEE